MDLPIVPVGSFWASARKASHIIRLRVGVKILRSKSCILKFSSCSLTTTAHPFSASAFVVMSERKSKILGRQRKGPSGSLKFELDLPWTEQIPATELQRLVDENAGKGFVLA